MTVNTGKFSSIKPSVELSVDVAAADTHMAYVHLSKVADSMMALELLALADEMIDINNCGWGQYRDILDTKVDQILESFMDNADKLVMMEM
jgi:hypothetical protein